MGKKDKLEQRTGRCEGGEVKPTTDYQKVLNYILSRIHHGDYNGTSRYSLRERLEIHERRHIPMTF